MSISSRNKKCALLLMEWGNTTLSLMLISFVSVLTCGGLVFVLITAAVAALTLRFLKS